MFVFPYVTSDNLAQLKSTLNIFICAICFSIKIPFIFQLLVYHVDNYKDKSWYSNVLKQPKMPLEQNTLAAYEMTNLPHWSWRMPVYFIYICSL